MNQASYLLSDVIIERIQRRQWLEKQGCLKSNIMDYNEDDNKSNIRNWQKAMLCGKEVLTDKRAERLYSHINNEEDSRHMEEMHVEGVRGQVWFETRKWDKAGSIQKQWVKSTLNWVRRKGQASKVPVMQAWQPVFRPTGPMLEVRHSSTHIFNPVFPGEKAKQRQNARNSWVS